MQPQPLNLNGYSVTSPEGDLRSVDVLPVRSDKVPGQRLPRHVVCYWEESRPDVHQTNLLRVQGVLQVSAREGRMLTS